MVGLNLYGTMALGLSCLVTHLASVTLTRALRTYSRLRLEELCLARGRPARTAELEHHYEPTVRSAESLAVGTGLALAALLGVMAGRFVAHLTAEAVALIAVVVGVLGYILAGVLGRVFAERVLYAFAPWARALRIVTIVLTAGTQFLEALVSRWAQPIDAPPRPPSVEVELPSDSGNADALDADLPDATRALVQRTVELTRSAVEEIMTPRSLMVALPATVSARVAARTFRETGKSRIPLFGENRDDILGVLYAKDLFPRMTDLGDPDAVVPRKLIRPPYYVPETKNALELLEEFRARRTQIAIVLDEYGGVAGLITFEDLIEELVGSIDDEHDIPTPEDLVVAVGEGVYVVDAALSLEVLKERLNLRLPTDGDFLTVGGFAFHALGRLPEPGATFRYRGVEYTVLEVADHSIRRVRLDLQPGATVARE